MKKWVRLAAKFYPLHWRRRYGVEFQALLDDTPCGWRDVANILWGAITMQMSLIYRNTTITCGVLGLVLAGGLALSIPNVYVSRAVVHVTEGQITGNDSEVSLPSGGALSGRMQETLDVAFSRASLASVIQRPDLDLYKSERSRKPLEDVIESMKQTAIKIQVLNSSDFVMTFIYPDPVIAQKTASALLAKLVDANQFLARSTANPKTRVTLDVSDPANLPPSPSYPNRWNIALLGCGSGALIGILVAMFRRRTYKT